MCAVSFLSIVGLSQEAYETIDLSCFIWFDVVRLTCGSSIGMVAYGVGKMFPCSVIISGLPLTLSKSA